MISHAKDRRLMEIHFSSIVLLSSPLLPSPLVDRAPSRSSTRAVHPPPRAINVILERLEDTKRRDVRFLRLQRISRSILDNQSISTVVD